MQIKIFIFFLTFCYLANFRVATILSTTHSDKRNVIVFVETLSIYLGFFYGEEHQM